MTLENPSDERLLLGVDGYPVLLDIITIEQVKEAKNKCGRRPWSPSGSRLYDQLANLYAAMHRRRACWCSGCTLTLYQDLKDADWPAMLKWLDRFKKRKSDKWVSIIKLPKKSGGFRTIYAPGKAYKKELLEHLPVLRRASVLIDKHRVSHGFMPCRSPISNAQKHIGFKYSLCFDLADFFDHCTVTAFRTACSDGLNRKLDEVIKLCFPDGAARQGLPTSPSIANICFSWVDRQIVDLIAHEAITYTRYADDLTFSFNSAYHADMLRAKIPDICMFNGFPVNEKKTRLLYASRGRRIITGVGVDDMGVHPTRKLKRRLRAAKHKKRWRIARGMAEWAKCKAPSYPEWALKRILAGDMKMEDISVAGVGAGE